MSIHPVYGAGIRTHDLSNMSRLPFPLDLGSRPIFTNAYEKKSYEYGYYEIIK